MLKLFRRPALYLLISLLSGSITVIAEAQSSILLINSWSEHLPWQQSIEEGFLSTTDNDPNTTVYTEHLDAERFQADQYHEVFANYLAKKYESIGIDTVVAESLPAVNFLLKNQSLFKQATRFYFPDSDKIDTPLNENETLIPVFEDYINAYNTMISVYNPDHIYIVADSISDSGRNQLERFETALAGYLDNDSVTFLIDKPMAKLTDVVSRLPPNSALFYLLVFKDGSGANFIPYKAARQISLAANAPVFSVWESLIGSGITGGYLLSGKRVGALAAAVALSDYPANTANTADAFGFYYDAQALDRFNINKKQLDKNAVFINATPSFYHTHTLEINVTLVALVLFMVLTAVLLIVNRKRQYLVKALQIEQDSLERRVFDRTQELNRLRIKAEKDARTDVLTGLNNRRAFFELGALIHSQSVRYNRTYSVMVIDVDLFKKVNDTYGHDAGDEALRVLSKTMQHYLRSSDVSARIGGEEFATVLTGPSKDDTYRKAEYLCRLIEKEVFSWKNKTFSITVSIGIAYSNEDDNSINSVLKRADQALYQAKARGRNQVVCDRN